MNRRDLNAEQRAALAELRRIGGRIRRRKGAEAIDHQQRRAALRKTEALGIPKDLIAQAAGVKRSWLYSATAKQED